MTPTDKPNPFQILRLPTVATREEIVERGQELCDLAESDDDRLLCRWAMEELITNPLRRLEYELFELPGAVYENAEWERFCRNHKRNPVQPESLAKSSAPLAVSDFDIGALLGLAVDGLLELPESDPDAAIRHLPFEIPYGPCPLEVTDVLFG